MTATKYLDIDELAEMLGRSPATIRRKLRSDRSCDRMEVPAPMYIPGRGAVGGARMLRWRELDVERWREDCF
jgi:predicted DNA-binding transcriptional regulator AlpA